jgi:hypothetical protein
LAASGGSPSCVREYRPSDIFLLPSIFYRLPYHLSHSPFLPEVPGNEGSCQEEGEGGGPEDGGVAQPAGQGAGAYGACHVAHEEYAGHHAEDDGPFFRGHGFGDDGVRAGSDESHAQSRNAPPGAKAGDGAHHVLHDEGESHKEGGAHQNPVGPDGFRNPPHVEGHGGAAAAGDEDDEAYDGGHQFAVRSHHLFNIKRQDGTDAGDAEIAEELHEGHEPHPGNFQEIENLAEGGFSFLIRPLPMDGGKKYPHREETAERQERKEEKGHAVAEGVGNGSAQERAEHDAHHHGRLEIPHGPGSLLLRRHGNYDGKADGHKPAHQSLGHAEEKELPGGGGKALEQGRGGDREKHHGHHRLRSPPVRLDGPEGSGKGNHEGRHPYNEPRPERRLPGVREPDFRKKKREERHDAYHGNTGTYLDKTGEIDNGFPVLHDFLLSMIGAA